CAEELPDVAVDQVRIQCELVPDGVDRRVPEFPPNDMKRLGQQPPSGVAIAVGPEKADDALTRAPSARSSGQQRQQRDPASMCRPPTGRHSIHIDSGTAKQVEKDRHWSKMVESERKARKG